MKKLFILTICALMSVQLSAQELSEEDNAAIDKRVSTFLNLVETKNYTQTLSLIYPKFFVHSPKDQMFQVFELLEKSGIELKFNDLKVLDKQQLPSENNIDYAMIKYKLNMELPLNTDELKSYAAFMLPMLQGNFGKENVEHNKSENYIKVTGEKFLVGVKDPAYPEWLFLIYDDSFMGAINKTLPAKVSQAAAAKAR